MEVIHFLVYVALPLWVLECAHGTFTDFVGNLPKKMRVSDVSIVEAFKSTWIRVMNNVKSVIKPKRLRRMGQFNAVTPTLRSKYTTSGTISKLNIPFFTISSSKYPFLWRSSEQSTENISKATTETSSKLPSLLPLLMDTTQAPIKTKKTDSVNQVNSFDVINSKSFRVRIFYKWQLDFL